ncbi:hypothetical protein NDU88_001132 [Pleurodeles waltl]|uniref:Uncharacterized protein n=1 Tax=Pleurodeles waltl TaxID=8319 RepID=A0AAV7P5R0_PLEWA|nr:hypothetical protein NDU88_001132 [Pleurodeles waltl]
MRAGTAVKILENGTVQVRDPGKSPTSKVFSFVYIEPALCTALPLAVTLLASRPCQSPHATPSHVSTLSSQHQAMTQPAVHCEKSQQHENRAKEAWCGYGSPPCSALHWEEARLTKRQNGCSSPSFYT